jgi:hypothetical protein
MVRSLFFALSVSAALLAATSQSEAQTIVHRPNIRGKGFTPSRSSHPPTGIVRFSARPIYPTRFHAMPIYPRTTFWSLDYPNVAVGPVAAYSLSDLGNLAGPTYYPGTEIPLGNPDFDAMLR